MGDWLTWNAWTVALDVLLAATAAGHALLHKRDPRAAWGWIAVCALFPMAGPALYLLFGINRVETQARRLVGAPPVVPPREEETADGMGLVGERSHELRELIRLGGAMTGRRLTGGNRIGELHGGEQAYPAMLEAIGAARQRVWLATYIYTSGRIGTAFAEALAQAQARGVEVRVLLDGVADLYSRPRASRLLRGRGVPAALFLPLRWFPPMLHANLRNHRKLLVVDDVAFTGGMNIADYHMAQGPQRERVQDLHFRIEGPLVQQIAAVFAADWQFAEGTPLAQAGAAPAHPGAAAGRVITDGPNEDIGKLAMVLVGALASARQRVWIMTPYLVPSLPLVAALQSAALRGVDVSIILPERSDQRWVDWASQNHLLPLLQREVRIYRQPAPFAHTKLFLVDQAYVQLGSANLDNRSLRLNFELVVEAFDPALAARLAAHFEAVRVRSRKVTAEQLRARSPAVQFRDAFFWLFSPYL
ncbi:MAG: PLDc N-terminal domain-containing protein [Nevskia sp.]|nr:PLDc N-terminal domain-containing protein [Nevskia sp.]